MNAFFKLYNPLKKNFGNYLQDYFLHSETQSSLLLCFLEQYVKNRNALSGIFELIYAK